MNFWKAVLANITGYILGSILVSLLTLFIVLGVVSALSSGKEDAEVEPKSVLKMELDGSIRERDSKNPLGELDLPAPFMGDKTIGLNGILHNIKKAASDPNIEGIYMNLSPALSGWASLESIREALIEFKKSGKFIYAYGEIYTEPAYYLASVSDSIFIFKNGYMEWNGLSSTPVFLKGALAKLEVEPVIFRVGTFKSAIEPFTNDKMSDANREQVSAFLNDMWNHFVGKISETRGISAEELNRIANNLEVDDAEKALKAKLVDVLAFEDEVFDAIKTRMSIEKDKKVTLVSMATYKKRSDKDAGLKKPEGKNKIAIIYAEGDINSGKSSDDGIGSETIVKAFRDARADSSVKAVVFRINSPGGSALASDVMWREVMLTKAVKPVIASYGNVAASGGYYISAACDKIVAQPNTITGSIGVFGLMFNTQKMFNNKLGVTFDRVTTNTYADLGNPNRTMNDFEKGKIQEGVNKIYRDFTEVVRSGRNFPATDANGDGVADAVDSIAQGRVWSGITAKQLGLVDELGGIDKALAIAAEMTGLEDNYKIKELPEQKDPFEEIFNKAKKGEEEIMVKSLGFEQEYASYKRLKSMAGHNGVYMLMPFDFMIR
jgi:protease IV